MSAEQLARTAAALKRDHGDLLRPQPSFRHPDVDAAWDALEAARERIAGEKQPDAQMALDLRPSS